jgi:uncharacterized protein with HEPN domain
MSRDEATLMDILKAARLVRSFVEGLDKASFLADIKTQSAALHQLLVLGEAVTRLTTEFRERHASIAWRQIAGMRNILIHHYDDVDLEEVWRTVSVDIPGLITSIELVLARLPKPQ